MSTTLTRLENHPNADIQAMADAIAGKQSSYNLEDKDYDTLFPPDTYRPKEFVYKFQRKAAAHLFTRLYIHNDPVCHIRGGVGVGKTYIALRFLQNVMDSGVLKYKSLCPYTVFYVTAANVVEQTKRVFRKGGLDLNRDVLVTNYDQLRASWGENYIEEIHKVEFGRDYYIYKWKIIHPLLFMWDEVQKLKNEQSSQSQIGQATNEITNPLVRQVSLSATPFTKISEAKFIAVSTHMSIEC